MDELEKKVEIADKEAENEAEYEPSIIVHVALSYPRLGLLMSLTFALV